MDCSCLTFTMAGAVLHAGLLLDLELIQLYGAPENLAGFAMATVYQQPNTKGGRFP